MVKLPTYLAKSWSLLGPNAEVGRVHLPLSVLQDLTSTLDDEAASPSGPAPTPTPTQQQQQQQQQGDRKRKRQAEETHLRSLKGKLTITSSALSPTASRSTTWPSPPSLTPAIASLIPIVRPPPQGKSQFAFACLFATSICPPLSIGTELSPYRQNRVGIDRGHHGHEVGRAAGFLTRVPQLREGTGGEGEPQDEPS